MVILRQCHVCKNNVDFDTLEYHPCMDDFICIGCPLGEAD